MDIAICIDNKYVMPCGVLICSICENNIDSGINFHIVSENLFHENKVVLKRIVDRYKENISFYMINSDSFKYCPVGQKGQPSYINISTYYRLILPYALPELNKVLYLDCDIIVRSSLNDLWAFDVDAAAVGAIIDDDIFDKSIYERLQYDFNYGYFNSGVLLMNLKYWRENNITNKLFDFIEKNSGKLMWHDQDALNFILHKEKVRLPIKYNVQTPFYSKLNTDFISYEEFHLACNDPAILHFSGPFKPWYKECENPFKSDFYYYLSKTEWKGLTPHFMKMSAKERFWFLQHKVRVIKSKWKK